MSIDKHEPWFAAKRYGYGWRPSSWQGWLIIALYIVLAIVGADFLVRNDESAGAIVYEIVLTVALIVVCAMKGEPPRWHWGGE